MPNESHQQSLEKLQSLKEFVQNRFKGEALAWLNQLVDMTKKNEHTDIMKLGQMNFGGILRK